MILETKRLILREYETSDFQDVHEYGSDPEVSKFDAWGPNTEQDTRNYIQSMIEQSQALPRFKFDLAIFHKESKRVIGGCGTRRDWVTSSVANIGYAVNPKFQGQGIATEAMRAILNFGFTKLDLRLIWATCDDDNIASYRVMEKLGMKCVGRIERYKEYKGRARNALRYEIMAPEPKSPGATPSI